MSKAIATSWLESFRETALEYDLLRHMAHISKGVKVLGVPGFDVINYNDWYAQCEREFPQKLIQEIDYSAPRISAEDDQRITFVTTESIFTSEAGNIQQVLEMSLENGEQGWQLTHLRILPDSEARQHGLLNCSSRDLI